MKTFLLTIGFAFGGMLTSFADAQEFAELTVDSTQSSVNITLNGDSSSSQISGTTTLEIGSSSPPSGKAQITQLDFVLDEALSFNFFIVVSASSSPGDVSLSLVTPGSRGSISNLVTPGPKGTPTGSGFTQAGNLVALAGELNVSDPFGFAGGSQSFDLSDIEFPPVDFTDFSVSESGGVITVSNTITINEMVDLGAGEVPLVVEANFVATGTVSGVIDLIGDVNLDGCVDFLDIAPFVAVLSAGRFEPQADIDASGTVDFLDIAPFIFILSN